MNKQEFIDEAAVRIFATKIGRGGIPTELSASNCYSAAEMLWQAREDRNKGKNDSKAPVFPASTTEAAKSFVGLSGVSDRYKEQELVFRETPPPLWALQGDFYIENRHNTCNTEILFHLTSGVSNEGMQVFILRKDLVEYFEKNHVGVSGEQPPADRELEKTFNNLEHEFILQYLRSFANIEAFSAYQKEIRKQQEAQGQHGAAFKDKKNISSITIRCELENGQVLYEDFPTRPNTQTLRDYLKAAGYESPLYQYWVNGGAAEIIKSFF